jgi:hypothetical protein
MPQIFELFGSPPSDRSNSTENRRKRALCPFTDAPCDGGGNRYQTSISLEKSPELRNYFDSSLDKVIPGVCSIEYGGEQWVVCPRRLMGFKSDTSGIPPVNDGIKPHEREALVEGGLPTGKQLGVWPEVNLRYDVDDTPATYRFDFIIAPIIFDAKISDMFDINDVHQESEREAVVDAARRGDWISGRLSSSTTIAAAPDLRSPFIVEIMTASTSGSKRSKRTDIASSFEDAILEREHQSPGINKRQVWGRMVTQLFSKSALAEEWGGRTLWVIQEELLKYMESIQQLSLSTTPTARGSAVDFVWLKYDDTNQSGGSDSSPSLQFENAKRVEAGVDFDGDNTCADILIPSQKPSRTKLLEAVLRSDLSARISL